MHAQAAALQCCKTGLLYTCNASCVDGTVALVAYIDGASASMPADTFDRPSGSHNDFLHVSR